MAGSSGDAELGEAYLKEISELYSLLQGTLGFSQDHIVVLFDDPSKNPGLIQHKSTHENLRAACLNLAGRVKKDDLVFVFIDGHGSYDGNIYKLNLPGPDPTDEDLAAALYSIPAGNFIIVNATSCSGGSLPALSRKGSIILTATKSGMEKNQTHIGRFFVDAFKNNAADSDKDGRVSMFEAFAFARQKVDQYYQSEGSLQTEHPVLEDNGDAKAQSDPTPDSGEGLIARTTYLDGGVPLQQAAQLSPERQKLESEAQGLMKEIESLKYAKNKMPEAEYEKRLEDLLFRLAQINEKLSK